MTIQHKNIPDADLHEVKGAASASAGKSLIATGTGTATFDYTNALGSTSFVNYAAPYVLAYPAVYTKLEPVTTASGVAVATTEGANARITYIGNVTGKFRGVCNISLSQSIGANRDLGIKLYKNGAALAGSEIFQTSTSGTIHLVTTIFDFTLATNDYIECFIQNKGASGDVSIYAFLLNIMGIRG